MEREIVAILDQTRATSTPQPSFLLSIAPSLPRPKLSVDGIKDLLVVGTSSRGLLFYAVLRHARN